MFLLAHISDIHLLPELKLHKKDLLGKRITGYLNLKHNRKYFDPNYLSMVQVSMLEHYPDHVAISGDLINLGLNEEVDNAKEWLSNLALPQNVSLTMGNHDAYVRGSFDYACKAYAAWLNGDLDLDSKSNIFPYVKIRDDVAIINLSSAIVTPMFCAAGYFDETQGRYLSEILDFCKEKGLFRVINIHHPPYKGAISWYKKLIGINRFNKIIANHGAELIIHGHTHKSTIYYNEYSIPVVGVGSASFFRDGHSNYNIFSIGRIKNTWKCYLDRYYVNNANEKVQLGNSLCLYC